MRSRSLLKDARSCRRKAIAYKGKPEFQFLLSAADAFEQLAVKQSRRERRTRAFNTKPHVAGIPRVEKGANAPSQAEAGR